MFGLVLFITLFLICFSLLFFSAIGDHLAKKGSPTESWLTIIGLFILICFSFYGSVFWGLFCRDTLIESNPAYYDLLIKDNEAFFIINDKLIKITDKENVKSVKNGEFKVYEQSFSHSRLPNAKVINCFSWEGKKIF